MLKRSLGPRDRSGMLSDQLRSAGHLSCLLQLRPQLFRAQIHRKKLQFELCYSDASCIMVCAKVVPQRVTRHQQSGVRSPALNRWLASPTFLYCDTAVTLHISPKIFIETIIYHGFLANMKLQIQLFLNKLLKFFHTCSLCVWRQCLHKSIDPFHPH